METAPLSYEENITRAREAFKSDNISIADTLREFSIKASKKLVSMVNEVETAGELSMLVNASKVIAETHGIATKEVVNNVNINAVTGFTFVEIGDDTLKQIRANEEYVEAVVE